MCLGHGSVGRPVALHAGGGDRCGFTTSQLGSVLEAADRGPRW